VKIKPVLGSFLFFIFFTSGASGQDLTGQWKGQFTDKSTSYVGWGGDRCDYVLEIECKGSQVSGYSYTYFNEGGKRYYTICRLTGKTNKASKYLEVTEVERTKTNVPNNIRNCFQIHKLTFFQQGDDQTLEGNWVPAPNQEGDCGFGTTTLTRRLLQKNPTLAKNSSSKDNKPASKPPFKPATTPTTKKTNPAILVRKEPRPTEPQKGIRKEPMESETGKITPSPVAKDKKIQENFPDINFEKRSSDLLKTIEIENETFIVDLYDNGEVDGDSISLFYNGILIMQHKRLSEKAISDTLKVDDSRELNELVMYAENLGEIPPNTALMVVTDGENRYEVRISSDLEKSGVIRFVHKPRKRQ
jgi:hypothetical protein